MDGIRDRLFSEKAWWRYSNEAMEMAAFSHTAEVRSSKTTDFLVRKLRDYERNEFQSDLSQCKTEESFEELHTDLEFIATDLHIDVTAMTTAVAERKDEFEASESDRADYQYDQWKEAHYMDRAESRDISDMFGSLPRQ